MKKPFKLKSHPAAAPSRSSIPAIPLRPERAAQLLERVIAIYEKAFADGKEGQSYLARLGITDTGLYTQHRLGWCGGNLKEMLPSGGAVWGELRQLGILDGRGKEYFRGCVVVPVCDADGLVENLCGIPIEKHPGKKSIFLPKRSHGIWNAVATKTYPEIILVDSIIDGLSLMQIGSGNVVAILEGKLDGAEVDLFRRQGVQKLTLLLPDEMKKKLMEKLEPVFNCRTLLLPGSKNPSAYLVQHGAEALAKALQETDTIAATKTVTTGLQDDNFLVFTYGLRRYEVRGLEKAPKKLKATIRVEAHGKLHVDTLDLYSARSRRQLAMDICRIFEEPSESIETDLNRLITACENAPAPSIEFTSSLGVAVPDAERKLATAMGKSPNLVQQILDDYIACGLVGEESNKLLCYLAMTSRKMDTPLSVLILSSSGAGKTALQDSTLSFVPPEDCVKLTSLSGKALFYKERLSLKHKVLALEEGDGAEEASYAIRNLISARELVIESAIKDIATGKLTTMINKVEGPTAVFLTTTNPEVDPESRSRFFVTSVDESREQTRRILKFQRQRQTLQGMTGTLEQESILKRHHAFQRLLKSLAVVNPHALRLSYGDDRLQGRRDQPKYLNLIKSVAFLRQMQKPIRETSQPNGMSLNYIEVDEDDIAVASGLAQDVLGHSLDELSRPSLALLLLLEEMVAQKAKTEGKNQCGFSRREIREFDGWANARVHRYLKELVELEYVLLESGRNGSLCKYRLAYEGQGKDGKRFILGLKLTEKPDTAFKKHQNTQ